MNKKTLVITVLISNIITFSLIGGFVLGHHYYKKYTEQADIFRYRGHAKETIDPILKKVETESKNDPKKQEALKKIQQHKSLQIAAMNKSQELYEAMSDLATQMHLSSFDISGLLNIITRDVLTQKGLNIKAKLESNPNTNNLFKKYKDLYVQTLENNPYETLHQHREDVKRLFNLKESEISGLEAYYYSK